MIFDMTTPTESGWYWWRLGRTSRWMIVYVDADSVWRPPTVQWMGSEDEDLLHDVPGWWGPRICPPEEEP